MNLNFEMHKPSHFAIDNTRYLDYLVNKSYIDFPFLDYCEFITNAAVAASENILIRKDLTYKYIPEQLNVVTKRLLGLGYRTAIQAKRHLITQTLFYKPQTLNAVLIEVNTLQETLIIETYATTLEIDAIFNKILSTLDKICYVVSLDVFSKNEKESTEVAMSCNSLPTTPDFYYPFLSKPLTEYFDSFIKSTSNILLLIGPPGTGKTNFLKTMFAHVKENVQMTYDENLINESRYFSDFLNSNNRFLVIEDADLIIQSRSEGNRLINKFLNTADGIIPNRKKKLIFTTNLPNLNHVDKAMIRPGRCFDILQFRQYNKQEAIKIAEYLNIDTKLLTSDKYTLAEIYDIKNNFSFHSKITDFGFI